MRRYRRGDNVAPPIPAVSRDRAYSRPVTLPSLVVHEATVVLLVQTLQVLVLLLLRIIRVLILLSPHTLRVLLPHTLQVLLPHTLRVLLLLHTLWVLQNGMKKQSIN
jgi:hypothetical protein